PAPPHACRRPPHAVTGVGPAVGLAGACAPLWRGRSGLAPGRPPRSGRLPAAAHRAGRTRAGGRGGGPPPPPPPPGGPRTPGRRGGRPAHAQPGRAPAAREAGGARAAGAETRTGGGPPRTARACRPIPERRRAVAALPAPRPAGLLDAARVGLPRGSTGWTAL